MSSGSSNVIRMALPSLSQGTALSPHARFRSIMRQFFETRMQVDAFLKEHEVYNFTAADFDQDRETLRQVRARGAQPRA